MYLGFSLCNSSLNTIEIYIIYKGYIQKQTKNLNRRIGRGKRRRGRRRKRRTCWMRWTYLNTLANSSEFCIIPVTRYFHGEWGSIWRTEGGGGRIYNTTELQTTMSSFFCAGVYYYCTYRLSDMMQKDGGANELESVRTKIVGSAGFADSFCQQSANNNKCRLECPICPAGHKKT